MLRNSIFIKRLNHDGQILRPVDFSAGEERQEEGVKTVPPL